MSLKAVTLHFISTKKVSIRTRW